MWWRQVSGAVGGCAGLDGRTAPHRPSTTWAPSCRARATHDTQGLSLTLVTLADWLLALGSTCGGREAGPKEPTCCKWRSLASLGRGLPSAP